MSRPWLSTALKAVVSAVLIWVLLDRIDLASIWTRISDIAIPPVAVAFGILLSQMGLITVRWWLVSRYLEVTITLGAALRLIVIGQFFNQTLPSAIGGDAVRVWMMTRLGVPLVKSISTILCDRVLALVFLLFFISASLVLIEHHTFDWTMRWSMLALIALSASGLAVLVVIGPSIRRLLGRWRYTRPLGDLALDFRKLFAEPRRVFELGAISLFGHLMTVAMAFFVAIALRINIQFVDCLLVIPPVILATMIPISIAGWGVREGSMVLGFGLVDVAAPDALAISVVFGALQLLSGVPGGVTWLTLSAPDRTGETS